MNRDEVVQHLYDCAAEERAFADVLGEIATLVRASYAHIFVVGSRGQLAESHFFGHDGRSFASYETYWRERDPRFALGNAHVGRVLSDVEHLEPAAFERSEIYNDFLEPFGVRYTLFGQLGLGDGLAAAQAFMRDRSEGPFEAEQIREVTLLLPHLRRALDLRRLVQRCQDQLADLRAALDLVPTPLAIVDDTGRVLCASASAERLLGAGDGPRIRQQRLSADLARTAREIGAAITRAASFADASRRATEPFVVPPVVEIPRMHARPLGLVFLPLRPRNALRDAGDARGRVLVVFDDPEASVELDPTVVRELYPLTPTEARLAVALANGQSLADFARERRCSAETARTHLKRVLEKTGTHRQAELVRVLLGRMAMRYVTNTR